MSFPQLEIIPQLVSNIKHPKPYRVSIPPVGWSSHSLPRPPFSRVKSFNLEAIDSFYANQYPTLRTKGPVMRLRVLIFHFGVLFGAMGV